MTCGEPLPISVVILTKDEESSIRGCIESVAWASQIIVYDSGSLDDTVQIAHEENVDVYIDAEWQGYGRQRQKAEECARFDWILMLDADERISLALADELRQIFRDESTGFAFEIPRLNSCFGRFIKHGGWYPDYVVRLYRRSEVTWNDALVHERLTLTDGFRVQRLKNPLYHYPYRDIPHYMMKSARYAAAWAENKLRQGRSSSIASATLHALWAMLRMYVLRLGFLDGRQGFLLAVLSAHSVYAKHAHLWDLGRRER